MTEKVAVQVNRDTPTVAGSESHEDVATLTFSD